MIYAAKASALDQDRSVLEGGSLYAAACGIELSRDGQDKASAQATRRELLEGGLLVDLPTYKRLDLIVEERIWK